MPAKGKGIRFLDGIGRHRVERRRTTVIGHSKNGGSVIARVKRTHEIPPKKDPPGLAKLMAKRKEIRSELEEPALEYGSKEHQKLSTELQGVEGLIFDLSEGMKKRKITITSTEAIPADKIITKRKEKKKGEKTPLIERNREKKKALIRQTRTHYREIGKDGRNSKRLKRELARKGIKEDFGRENTKRKYYYKDKEILWKRIPKKRKDKKSAAVRRLGLSRKTRSELRELEKVQSEIEKITSQTGLVASVRKTIELEHPEWGALEVNKEILRLLKRNLKKL